MLSANIVKQIIVITDGRSNQGESPVSEAWHAKCKGLTVNTIGLLDSGRLGAEGRREVEQIAASGGGACYLIALENLGKTVHTMTIQAARKNAEFLVNQQLLARAGVTLPELSPDARAALLPVISDLEEAMEIQLVLAIDTSGSMAGKRDLLADSLTDLMVSLGNRIGVVRLGIIQFPGPGGNGTLLKPLHSDNSATSRLLRALRFGGLTPTGPAIKAAVSLLEPDKAKSVSEKLSGIWESAI